MIAGFSLGRLLCIDDPRRIRTGFLRPISGFLCTHQGSHFAVIFWGAVGLIGQDQQQTLLIAWSLQAA
jgi:hypothetical protein